MSRHRSPSGRRAHLGPPLLVAPATAGVGVGRRSSPITSTPARLVASVVAGGALAAAGQQALVAALPAADEGANVLRMGVEQLLGAGAPAALTASASTASASTAPASTAALSVAVGPVAPVSSSAEQAPAVADAASLVKAAGLAQAAEQARADEAARLATAAAAAAQAAAVAASRVEMIVGRVTSGFGGRWGTVHQGLDIAAPIGTPIHAPLAGTVISSGPAGGFGLWVRLQHADGTITVYGHINRSLVTVGEKVRAGATIAEVGNRGDSTGPHLHIGVLRNGSYVNPRPWLDQHGIRY